MRDDYKFENGNFKILSESSWKTVVIPNVSILNVIGTGANAVVVKGLQHTLNREVAVKIWLPNKKSKINKVSKEQFLEEIQKLASLNDDRIVQVHFAEECNGLFYSIMRFVDGLTLKEWLVKNNGKNLDIRTKIAESILEVMSGCHSKMVFHGDLHDKNILIDGNNKVNILDFGSSYFSRKFNEQLGKQRDNYFLTTLIINILNNKSLVRYFDFSVPTRVNLPLSSNDVRSLEPQLLATTLASMTRINAIFDLDLDFTDHSNRHEIIQEIVVAPYFNIRMFSEYFYERSGEKLLLQFWSSLENEVMESWNTDENLDASTFMIYATSAAYYSLLKKIEPVTAAEDIKQFMETLHFQKVEDFLALINFIINSTDARYLDLIDTLSKNLPRNTCSCFIYELRVFLFSKLLQLMRNINNTPPPEVHYYVNAEYLKVRNDEYLCKELWCFADLDDNGTLDAIPSKIADSDLAMQDLRKAGVFVVNNYFGHEYFID